VRVPWKPLNANAASPSPEVNLPESSPSSGRNTNVILEDAIEKPELVTIPTAFIDLSDTRAQVPLEPASAQTPSAIPDVSSADSASTASDESMAQTTSARGSSDSTTDQPNPEDKQSPHVTPRVLLKKHFDVALSEIRPSSSEEGSLPELRKVSSKLRASLNFSGLNNLARAAARGDGRRALAKALASAIPQARAIAIKGMAKSYKTTDHAWLYICVLGIRCRRRSELLSCALQCPLQYV